MPLYVKLSPMHHELRLNNVTEATLICHFNETKVYLRRSETL